MQHFFLLIGLSEDPEALEEGPANENARSKASRNATRLCRLAFDLANETTPRAIATHLMELATGATAAVASHPLRSADAHASALKVVGMVGRWPGGCEGGAAHAQLQGGPASCSSFPEGNLLAWNSQNWMLNSSRATAVEDDLDLQDEVCPSSSSLSVTHCTTWWSCLMR